MTPSHAARPGALSAEAMRRHMAPFPGYGASSTAPAKRFATEVQALWGGVLTPMMASGDTAGRFAGAALSCPPTACTGALELAAGACTQPYRNPCAIENLVCVEGRVEVSFGPALADSIVLEAKDMLSVPEGMRHRVRNAGDSLARLVVV